MIIFYRKNALSENQCISKKKELQNIASNYAESTKKSSVVIKKLDTEFCFYISTKSNEITNDCSKLKWILGEPFEINSLSDSSWFQSKDNLIIEIGPRLSHSTPFSTNAISICRSIGLLEVDRIEVSTRYCLELDHKNNLTLNLEQLFVDNLHDKMTQCRYMGPLKNFGQTIHTRPWYQVDVLNEGREALKNASLSMGLAMDDWDIDYYTNMFRNQLKRNPTSVECFDLAQSNSEHSRHWFFKGDLIIDGIKQERTLIDLVISTQDHSNQNNVIKFSDNSSAIQGSKIKALLPLTPWKSSKYTTRDLLRHIIFTAETHNFPTAVSPFSGAATGTGGRIRDVHAAGRGAHVIAGIAGYCFGNLNLSGDALPWEKQWDYPRNFAHPREVAVEASNGASDYGNKFGEPVITGFARSCGIDLDDRGRREWIKPIMFSGGIGSIDDSQITKKRPVVEMEVVKIGGPVYRIGVGGGAASSVQIQGDNVDELDFGAVQRGDAEMEQKLNRVIRACIEMDSTNPICSIHDQGAGGNGNVLKEIVDPEGAVIYSSEFQLGDPTINILELWGAEYQESDAILIEPQSKEILKSICERENCTASFVGKITGDKKITLIDNKSENKSAAPHPVELDLDLVLGKMPQKVFNLDKKSHILKPLNLPEDLTCMEALKLVLRLPSVASKRYLTNKVDRCVTGLVAQQQCVGPLHTPLADVAVVALSYFDTVGGAVAVGEQPFKGLVDSEIGARMSLAEAVTNLMFAKITDLRDVKCSANWMWPAKLPGEGAELYSACLAMTNSMKKLGVAVDGGKDSLSMAARVSNITVKAPGAVVISVYARCPDITKTVTPDLKCPGNEGCILLVQLFPNKARLGGTALAQVFSQIGNDAPDLDNEEKLRDAFKVTQKLIDERKISAGHDISDGGLITCLLEMAFAGNCGLKINLKTNCEILPTLFSEEVGWVLEVAKDVVDDVVLAYNQAGILCTFIGNSTDQQGPKADVLINLNNISCVNDKMTKLREIWEETSFQLEKRQMNIDCAIQEQNVLKECSAPSYFWPHSFESVIPNAKLTNPPRVAVIREEGINGDRELSASFFEVGFEVWDVTMNDVLSEQVTLDSFQGLIFPGGFSYADVLGSAKGWAAAMQFNQSFCAQLKAFRERETTFSLGICNGCQLLALLGWVAPDEQDKNESQGVILKQNISERFECRFSSVKIEESPSILLKGMSGATLGVWVAHGEGRFEFKNERIKNSADKNHLIPMRYVDDCGEPTTRYPFNPNGSLGGIAALCSENGRHLAVMPHPERCIFPWQWAWMPLKWRQSMETSPWLRMFENAYRWCIDQRVMLATS